MGGHYIARHSSVLNIRKYFVGASLSRTYVYLVDPALDADNVGSLGPGQRLEGLLLLQIPAQGPEPSLEHHQYLRTPSFYVYG